MSFKAGLRRTLATALTLSALSAPALAAEIPLDRIIAIVDDNIVLKSELDQRLLVIQQQLAAKNTRLPPQDVLRKQVLNRLVIDAIQLQLAKEQGIRVSDRQLNQSLERIAASNGMNLEQFREALIAEGQDYNAAREQIRKELLLTQVQQRNVNRRIKVSEQELATFLNSDAGKAQGTPDYLLSYILIALPTPASPEIIRKAEKEADSVYQQLKDGADFSELAVAHSDAQNALNGGDLGWRKGAELPEAMNSTISQLEIGSFSLPVRTPMGFVLVQLRDKKGGTTQMIQQTRVSHILLKTSEIRNESQARNLAREVHLRLRNGENFEQLAKEYSDDPGSGSEGGALGWASPGQMVGEFEQVMNNTPQGAISEPFESRFGWHILTVHERRQQDVSEEMKEANARSIIRKRKFNAELTNWLREIRSQAYVEFK